MNRLFSAARANFLLSASSVVIAISSNVVIVRSLGPGRFADYATMLGILTWCLLIFEAGGNSGLMRFFPEAERIQARAALLRQVLRLRLIVSLMAGLTLVLAGPFWVHESGLSLETWSTGVFLALAVAVAAGLLGLPAQFAMLAEFRHGPALLINQTMTVLRAVTVASIAWFAPSLDHLALAVACIAIIEGLLYHRLIWPQFAGEPRFLPPGIFPSVLRYGLVTVFDKLSSQIGNGPFLLVVLAAVVARAELGLLAVATDLGVKVLSLAGMPIGAMILPYLNAARVAGGSAHATGQVARLSAILFSTVLGGYLAVVGAALPLLFGDAYRDATSLAQIIAVAIFVDAWGRQTFSAALITTGSYRIMNLFNIFLAAGAILLLAVTWSQGLHAIVAAQAALRIVGTAVLVTLACRAKLWRVKEAPLAWVGLVFAATGSAWLVQWLLAATGWGGQLVGALAVFGLVLLVGLRSRYCLDPTLVTLVYRVAGRHSAFLRFLFGPAPHAERAADRSVGS